METSFVASEEYPSIYRIRFMPSELTNLYNDILPNVAINQVNDHLIRYVTSCIEPIGWHAIWRTVPNDGNGLSTQYDLEVEIIDVLHHQLVAIGVVLRQLHPKDSELTAEQMLEKEKLLNETKVVNIPLTQLYVISDGDEDNQFHRTALVIEHIRFFYTNLWRPWDELDNSESAGHEVFVETRLKPRLELSFDMKDKIIPQSTVNRIKNLLSESWAIKRKIDSIDSYKSFDSMDISIEDNSEIDYINETDLVQAMRLKLRLEDIEREMRLLEDKHLRIIAASLRSNTGDTNGFEDESISKQNKIHLIGKTFTVEPLKDILNSLSQVMTDPTVPLMFYNSLSQALASVRSSDKIFLMPGLYSCPILPWIESDIEINGFGGTADEIIIEAKDSVGDIFLNCNSNKVVFTGLTMRSTSELQCLLMIHKGFVSFNNCVLDGAHQTRNALIVLSKAKVEIENTRIINESGNGIISRKGSVVINRDIEQNLNQKQDHKSHEMHINLNGDSPSAPLLDDIIDT